jgi:hypothetical protein
VRELRHEPLAVRATALPQDDKMKVKINVNGDGQECPSHTDIATLACPTPT